MHSFGPQKLIGGMIPQARVVNSEAREVSPLPSGNELRRREFSSRTLDNRLFREKESKNKVD